MRIVIDNLDGSGALHYSGAVLLDAPVRIERRLNASSRCVFDVLIEPGGLPLPARRGRVVLSSDAGAVLFTGYLATEPVRVYVSAATNGAAFRAKLNAVSDEWLLDKLGPGAGHGDGLSLGLDAREALLQLLERLGSAAPAFAVSSSGAPMAAPGAVTPGASWSAGAANAAGAAYAAYRVVNGQALVQPAGTVVHPLSDADGTLSIADFRTAEMRELANDVTVSGEEEPAAFVTEVFTGDGTTAEFALSEAAFRGAGRELVKDRFDAATIDATQWHVVDPGSHLAITSAGLTLSGGDGVDGDTTLTALDAVEMGGSVLVEILGVRLAANSDGMLGGMYAGPGVLAACFAGFRVRQSGGSTVIVPVVSGAEIGTEFTALDGHSYTLRLRLHCAEVQRVMQRYTCMVDGSAQTFGSSGGAGAPMDLLFEAVDGGLSSNTPATVLYDSAATGGAIELTPATCGFAAVNSTRLYGSVGSVEVTRPGTVWVMSTLPDGTKVTRLTGGPNEGVDCAVDYGSAAGQVGKVTFFAGRVPVAGERVTVMYRTRGRSVARIADAVSIAAEAAAGVPGTSRWLGKVLQPPARSSADCESAAAAILAFATSRSAAIEGTYVWVDPAEDVWPGDLLEVTGAGVTTALLVRSVTVESAQKTLRYRIAFANDWATEWADGLGLKLSEAIASDAEPPEVANTESLASLSSLQVISVSETALGIDAGLDPLTGGGFEVRRRDSAFGPGSDVDLVLRSPVRNFSIPRTAQVERYYVRMYDASAPPKYSRFASAVLVNAPVE